MFEWDLQKAISNFEKHGVSFEEAATVFADENGLDIEDIVHSKVEPRHKRLGQSVSERILLVVYTTRGSHESQEKIRIISARQASKKERQTYFG